MAPPLGMFDFSGKTSFATFSATGIQRHGEKALFWLADLSGLSLYCSRSLGICAHSKDLSQPALGSAVHLGGLTRLPPARSLAWPHGGDALTQPSHIHKVRVSHINGGEQVGERMLFGAGAARD